MPNKNGHTRRQQLHKVYNRFGKWHEDLNDPQPYWCAAHILNIFFQLNKHRRTGFSGSEAISMRDILDYQELWEMKFDAWELDAILEMDWAYRSKIKEIEDKDSGNSR